MNFLQNSQNGCVKSRKNPFSKALKIRLQKKKSYTILSKTQHKIVQKSGKNSMKNLKSQCYKTGSTSSFRRKMANPVLIAKLALVAADPKTWQKIIIACISIFIISAALLGSCGAMTFTDLGFDCSQLFSAKLNEYSAVFDSGARINDKLLYAVYAKIFADNDRLKNQTDKLIEAALFQMMLSLTDSDEI